MTKNFPVLYQNAMAALPNNFANEVFLWAVERPGEDAMCYRAEAFAREADYIFRACQNLIGLADWTNFKAATEGVSSRVLSEDQREELMSFVMTRHANYRYGGNVKPSYAGVK